MVARWHRRAVTLLVAATTVAVVGGGSGVRAQTPPAGPLCAPGGAPVLLDGTVSGSDGGTYQVHPFEVAAGTTRIEVAYDWRDLTGDGLPSPAPATTVVDAGLWDQAGYRDTAGFRGWSGSRQGRVATGQSPIVVQQDQATRGYRPAPIEPGTWWLDLGFALVASTGASWDATISCTDPAVDVPFTPTPVDPDLVVDPTPGWYHADLHAHGYHSAANAPPWDDIVAQARDAGLEVLPVTEYVTGQHWDELGAVQDRNPDLLLWPGREIITYAGHAIVLGETRSVLEYRHGFEDVSMGDIQAASLADGALFGVAHPTSFPGPLASFCRGCEYRLDAVTDWSRVDTIEVLTGPVLASPADIGLPAGGVSFTNPFLATAIDRWEELLQEGHRVTAVSGSDSKANEPADERARRGLGSSATAIHATELSRPALAEGLRAGRAYIRTLGALRSPSLEVTATAPDGATAGIGDDLAADAAELEVTVRGGEGDLLVLTRNGEAYGLPVPISADPFTTTLPIERDEDSEGPLGTWVRLDTTRPIEPIDEVPVGTEVARFPSTIANPIYLTGEADPGDGDDGDDDGGDAGGGGDADDGDGGGGDAADDGGDVDGGADDGEVGGSDDGTGDGADDGEAGSDDADGGADGGDDASGGGAVGGDGSGAGGAVGGDGVGAGGVGAGGAGADGGARGPGAGPLPRTGTSPVGSVVVGLVLLVGGVIVNRRASRTGAS